MAMTCREVQEFFSDLFDGELPLDRKRPLESHIATCPECHVEYDVFLKSMHALTTIFAWPLFTLWIDKGMTRRSRMAKWSRAIAPGNTERANQRSAPSKAAALTRRHRTPPTASGKIANGVKRMAHVGL